MTDKTPQDPMAGVQITKYNVLMMTAAVISCEAASEVDAAQRALIEGPAVLDPTQLQWVVRYVSDKEIHLGDPNAEQELTEEAEAEANKPRIELIK